MCAEPGGPLTNTLSRKPTPLSPPGRRLPDVLSTPSLLQTADLRRQWMDAYAAAGGAVEEVRPSPRVGQPTIHCPNWIELRYWHCDGTPVKKAQYHVRSPAFATDGPLNDDGFVHIDGVPDLSGFTYWFDQDLEPYAPKGPAVSTASGPAKAAAVSALDAIGTWLWGTVQGDFNKDQSVSQIVVNTLLGLIPIVDQVLDGRDLIAGLKAIIEFYAEDEQQQRAHEEMLGLSYETWVWINACLIALGCIPELGSAMKGVLKCLIRFLQDALKKAGNLSPAQLRRLWEEVLKVLNRLGIQQGNAHAWLKEMSGKLRGRMDEATDKLRGGLKTIEQMMDKVEEYARRFAGKKLLWVDEILSVEQAQQVIARVQKYKAAIAKAYGRLEEMKRQMNAWLSEQLQHILGGKHNFEANGSINTPAGRNGSNVRAQEKTEPPDIHSPLAISKLQQAAETAEAEAKKLAVEIKNSPPSNFPGKKRPVAATVIVDQKTGKVYKGTSNNGLARDLPEGEIHNSLKNSPPSKEKWPVENCSEWDAMNQALKDGANREDLVVYTVKTKTGEPFPACANCSQHTTKGTRVITGTSAGN